MINVGDILSTMGCSVPWGDIMSTVGVILSTVWDVQYHGGIMMRVEGYHDYRGGYSVLWGEIFCYLSTPRY